MPVPLQTVLGRIPAARREKIERRADELAADVKQRASPARKSGTRFHIFKDDNGDWRWRLTAANGRTIASAGEGYKAKQRCMTAIELVRSSADAEVVQD